MGSFGYVGNFNTNKDKGLVSASLGLGLCEAIQPLTARPIMRGTNPTSSIADYFMGNAENKYPEDLDAFYERLAFDAYVIDTTRRFSNKLPPHRYFCRLIRKKSLKPVAELENGPLPWV